MTRLFGKKNKQTTIAELEEYYANQNQKKSRPLKAWLMALLSLLITVAIIIALFLGGRWLYRTFVDDNDGSSTTTTSDNSGETVVLPSFDGGFGDDAASGSSDSSDSSDDSSESSDGNVASNSNSDSSTSSEGVVSDEAASTSESNEDRISSPGPNEEELPNTGAGDLVFLLPIIVAAGYFAALKRQSK